MTDAHTKTLSTTPQSAFSIAAAGPYFRRERRPNEATKAQSVRPGMRFINDGSNCGNSNGRNAQTSDRFVMVAKVEAITGDAADRVQARTRQNQLCTSYTLSFHTTYLMVLL